MEQPFKEYKEFFGRRAWLIIASNRAILKPVENIEDIIQQME